MRPLDEYIQAFEEEGKKGVEDRLELADFLKSKKKEYDVVNGVAPVDALQAFISIYNFLGAPSSKTKYKITQNLARNLPGALMQDFLVGLVSNLCKPYPQLDVFSEVKVPFGRYPLWEKGNVSFKAPAEHSDLAVGYLVIDGAVAPSNTPWPKALISKLQKGQAVLPLATFNTKIRVSQSEFFDWYGRHQLMTKGNPHCFSVQVALRKEMDFAIVEASQAESHFFLLGEGGETSVKPDNHALADLITAFTEHLHESMVHEPH
jgi:hypothetical protein